MSSSIPLIRASAVIPCELWLRANGRDAANTLMAAGLPPSPSANPLRLASLHALAEFLTTMAETEGPDFGARIATPEALMQLGAPARGIRSSRTLREAFRRISATFYQHVSLIFLFANERPGGMEVTETISIGGTAAMLHQSQQHVAMLIRCIGEAAFGTPLPMKVSICPHPDAGVDHLRPWLGDDIIAEPGRLLRLWIADDILDREFPWDPELHITCDEEGLKPASRASLAESAQVLIAGMVEDGNPSMDRLALCAGRSRRTLQRMLESQGASFATLLDAIRKHQVLEKLAGGHASVSSIAQGVGFHSPSSLTRAVRRWTNATPRAVRKGQGLQ